jgi:thioredoxin-related protein
MREYDINGFPTLIFINPDGKIGKKIVGTVDAKRLIVVAKEVLKNN